MKIKLQLNNHWEDYGQGGGTKQEKIYKTEEERVNRDTT
jgi:hypothetical protein